MRGCGQGLYGAIQFVSLSSSRDGVAFVSLLSSVPRHGGAEGNNSLPLRVTRQGGPFRFLRDVPHQKGRFRYTVFRAAWCDEWGPPLHTPHELIKLVY
jgi:hypothetical protein